MFSSKGEVKSPVYSIDIVMKPSSKVPQGVMGFTGLKISSFTVNGMFD